MNINTETQTLYYKIVRKDSPYNKYIKWYCDVYASDKTSVIASSGYRTEKEARAHISNTQQPMPIGNRIVFTVYKELSG